ncbi:MAG: hypothetical protein ABH872_02250 [Candidatus Omnitrophota bacterium]
MDSPLLYPVRLENNIIYVLDETQLPFKEDFIEVKDLDKALWVLSGMKTRSLGQVLLFFYCCELFNNTFSIDDIAVRFKKERPTFDFDMLRDIIKLQTERGTPVKKAVDYFVHGFDVSRRLRAKKLAQILPNPANILTICNINGELICLYEELKKLNKSAYFIVCETRPYLQGARLTMWELMRNNIPCRLICDNQAAFSMKQNLVNCVVTGCDRAATKGDIINKIGTYALSRLANYFNIPFYPLTQYPRDIDIDSIDIEERPKNELFMYLKCNYNDIDGVYPCFDITKKEFITESIVLSIKGEKLQMQDEKQ